MKLIGVTVSVGYSSLNEINNLLQLSKKYFNKKETNVSSCVMYYNQEIYKDFEVFTLNGSLISSKGNKPIEYTYSDASYQNDKTRMFEYDYGLKRHVYGSYDMVNDYKSLLRYKISMTNNMSIRIKVKPNSKYKTNKRVIYEISNIIDKLTIYIKQDNKIYISLNTVEVSTNITISDDEWSDICVVRNIGIVMLKINNYPLLPYILNPTLLNDNDLYVGMELVNNIPTNHLNGNIYMLCISNITLTDNQINNHILNGGVGVITGMLGARGISRLGATFAGAGIGGISNLASQLIQETSFKDIKWSKVITGLIIGGIAGFLGGAGAKNAKTINNAKAVKEAQAHYDKIALKIAKGNKSRSLTTATKLLNIAKINQKFLMYSGSMIWSGTSAFSSSVLYILGDEQNWWKW